MEINISKFMGGVTVIALVFLFSFFGYFSYLVFFVGNSPSGTASASNINVSIFGTRMQKVASVLANASDRIALKAGDIKFTQDKLFQSFTEKPREIPFSDSRGRPNPFVPYAAP